VTKFLIVDDNEQNLYMLQVLLKGHGYEVESARDGAEALEKARRDPPDVIVSDILMPVMDGFALCREWEKDEVLKGIPFVFYTATYTDPKDEEFALSLGAERFIVKPAEPDTFVGMVQEVLENHEAGRLVTPREPVAEEAVYFKQYNEALIRKLENKMLQLEEANRALERDIARRKRAEEEIEKLAKFPSENPNPVLRVAKDGTVIYANEAALPLLNVWGCQVDQTLPDDWRQFTSDVLSSGSSEDTEVECERRILSLTFAPVVDADYVNVYGLDITERKQAGQELRRSFEELRRSLEGTVHVLVSAIEMRDPYTAGHQRRVARLACAIANEMGLPEERIEGIHMAGLIHDLGKITVPAEILSKPSQLNDFEWGMIKMHPQVGYDVLKTVEFPWPVAQIVRQHHERMDGSGYPQGSSGEDVLLEARILAVADVVEAMASHRPYRPPLGMDKALEEISKNRSVLYDAEVVDVCLKLFTEDGFTFE